MNIPLSSLNHFLIILLCACGATVLYLRLIVSQQGSQIRQRLPELPANSSIRLEEREDIEQRVPQWINDSDTMHPLNEAVLRCAAEDFGTFSLVSFFQPALQHVEKNQCLWECFRRKYMSVIYAGLTAKGSCYCGASLKYLVTNARLDIAESIDMAVARFGPPSQNLQENLGLHESTGMAEFSLETQRIGCIALPTEMNGTMKSWVMENMTSVQCILQCENLHYLVAVPVLSLNACICSDLFSLYTTADKMYASTKACANASGTANGNLLEVYRTFAEDTFCEPKRFLEKSRKNVTALQSFPGSGNTWIRHLIEAATGVYTGSRLFDGVLFDGGMLGDIIPPASDRKIAIKDHMYRTHIGEEYSSAITLIRNIYDCTLAEYTRQKSRSHVGTINQTLYNTAEFRKFACEQGKIWYGMQKKVLENISPVLVVYYEDLLADPVSQLRRITEFLPVDSIAKDGDDLERRLMCMVLNLKGDFQRPPKHLEFDPYGVFVRKVLDMRVKEMDRLLQKYNQPRLPPSYYGL